MRPLFWLGLALLISVTTSCVTYYVPVETSAPSNGVQMAWELRDRTVGLFSTRGRVYCSGVWVSDREILTAAHCVESGSDEEEVLGSEIWYAVANEVGNPGDTPSELHLSVVVGHDNAHDLALLYTQADAPLHSQEHIADAVPLQAISDEAAQDMKARRRLTRISSR